MRLPKLRIILVLLFGIVSPIALDTRADAAQPPVFAYDSFGPGNSYNTGIAWAVSGASASPAYRGQAQFFIPTVSGYLDQVELATVHISGSLLSDFFIADDNGSGIPGDILESWTGVQNASSGLLTLNSVAQPLLQAGQEYWLCDEPGAANSYNGWYQNNQGISPGDAFDRSEWAWSTIPAGIETAGVFSVTVVPVPEPSTVALVFSALLAGGVRPIRAGLSRWKSC